MDYARNVAPFRVVRKPVSPKICSEIDVSAGYNYRILHPDGRVGDAQLVFASVDQFNRMGLSTSFGDAELRPDETLAHINEFYPNGRCLDEFSGEYMRTGVGSAVLQIMKKDALEQGSSVMFAISGRPSCVPSCTRRPSSKGRIRADSSGTFFLVARNP